VWRRDPAGGLSDYGEIVDAGVRSDLGLNAQDPNSDRESVAGRTEPITRAMYTPGDILSLIYFCCLFIIL
jgi:hypothetical protein